MSLFSRFFGRQEEDDRATQLVANRLTASTPLSLQLLAERPLGLAVDRLAAALRAYDPAMANATCELEPDPGRKGSLLGLIGWRNHVIRLVSLEEPFPAEAVEQCVAPAHYPAELKNRARRHTTHVMLYYAGQAPSRHEQYIALAATAGALATRGTLVVMNEAAHTSFPAAALADFGKQGHAIELLRALPVLFLYCGFVTFEAENAAGVWMRTYGGYLLGMPDLAVRAQKHSEGPRYFDILNSIFEYALKSGAKLEAGHTMQVGEHEFLRCRNANLDEYFLDSPGEVLVAEIIGAD